MTGAEDTLMTKAENEDSYTVPVWFVRVASAVLLLAIPWAGWVTTDLATIKVRTEDVSKLDDHLDGHLQDVGLHQSKALQIAVEKRVDSIEKRLQRLEDECRGGNDPSN